jgi:hypothetical protein
MFHEDIYGHCLHWAESLLNTVPTRGRDNGLLLKSHFISG